MGWIHPVYTQHAPTCVPSLHAFGPKVHAFLTLPVLHTLLISFPLIWSPFSLYSFLQLTFNSCLLGLNMLLSAQISKFTPFSCFKLCKTCIIQMNTDLLLQRVKTRNENLQPPMWGRQKLRKTVIVGKSPGTNTDYVGQWSITGYEKLNM
jgi:hypothetical protein